MTEPTEIVDDRTTRLARLQARRATSPTGTQPAPSSTDRPAPTVPGPDSLPTPTAASNSTAPVSSSHERAPKPPRRRSPATNAKIITIGVSTTALLGMMAGYGIADGLTSESPEATASTPAAPIAPAVPIAPILPASPTTTPPAPVTIAPPQVIVVMVDAATGRPISTTTGSGTGVLDSALGSLPWATPAPAPAADNSAAAANSSAGASTPSELAPAAPTPPATPAAAPAPVAAPAAVDLAIPATPQPAPAAAPQASSGGS